MEQFTTKLKVGDFRLDTTENLVIGEAGVLNELTESQVKVLKVLAVARIEGNQGYHNAEKISAAAHVGQKTVANCVKALNKALGVESIKPKYGYGYRMELPVSRFEDRGSEVATGNSLQVEAREVAVGGYHAGVSPEPSQNSIQVPFMFEHRHSSWLENLVQGESSTVLFVSISSRHTLDRIRPWFDTKGLIKTRHFRVLTWWPSKDALASLSSHVGEKFERMKENIRSAWTGWRELQEANDFVEVYRYNSTPTMQAICTDRYIKIELLPYNRKGACFHECGSPDNRPGLVMDTQDDIVAPAYGFFKNAFEDLWLTAMLNAPQKDIHPKWRRKRLERLSKLGLSARRTAASSKLPKRS